jgi:lipid-A-disaccharide synthase
MTGAARPFRLGVVAGEESGDLLGADLADALATRLGHRPDLVGVGGHNLAARGLSTIFDGGEIALMGVTAVIASLPRVVRRIGETARVLADSRPDCVVLIDSPDFNLRVAKKLRAIAPDVPIIQYVCPSVWAWRPGRAVAMRAHVDHVLCILPFEVAELERLGGPPGTYVGHRLMHDAAATAARASQQARPARPAGVPKTLLVLPGSRRSEVRALLQPFAETAALMESRPRIVIPTVPHVEELVRAGVATWPVAPEVVVGAEAKWRAFGEADAAIAASGTVALELALVGVPHVSCYTTDPVMRLFFSMITVWSGSLPNLIAGYPIVPEYFDHFVRPSYLARLLPLLMRDGPTRQAQLAGFSDVAERMATARPAGELAAEVVMKAVGNRHSAVGE